MTVSRKILAIIPNLAVFRQVEGLLEVAEVGVHRAPSGAGGLILLGNRRYDLVLVEAPLPDLDLSAFLSSVRSLDSLCGSCPIVLLTPHREAKKLARRFRGAIAAAISKTSSESELQKILSRVLGVSSRAGARLLVEVKVGPPSGPSARLFQTQNLSQSGMLLRASEVPAVGSRVEISFSLPSDSRAICCEAVVVRHADPVKEGLQGFAVQFLDLRDDERDRLRGYVDVDLSAAPQVAAAV